MKEFLGLIVFAQPRRNGIYTSTHPRKLAKVLGKHNISLIREDQERFIKISKLELEVFKPIAVITWGQVASEALNSITSSFNHFKFPHPSPANHKTWSKMMGKPATRANRIDFWQEKVMIFLNNLS